MSQIVSANVKCYINEEPLILPLSSIYNCQQTEQYPEIYVRDKLGNRIYFEIVGKETADFAPVLVTTDDGAALFAHPQTKIEFYASSSYGYLDALSLASQLAFDAHDFSSPTKSLTLSDAGILAYVYSLPSMLRSDVVAQILSGTLRISRHNLPPGAFSDFAGLGKTIGSSSKDFVFEVSNCDVLKEAISYVKFGTPFPPDFYMWNKISQMGYLGRYLQFCKYRSGGFVTQDTYQTIVTSREAAFFLSMALFDVTRAETSFSEDINGIIFSVKPTDNIFKLALGLESSEHRLLQLTPPASARLGAVKQLKAYPFSTYEVYSMSQNTNSLICGGFSVYCD